MPDPISWAHSWPYFAIAFAFGYGLGSIPFGLLLTRLAGLGDVRKIGSGHICATNVLRTGRKGLAALPLLPDGGKGCASAWIAGTLYGPEMTVTPAAAVYSPMVSMSGVPPLIAEPVIGNWLLAVPMPSATAESDAVMFPESQTTVTVVTLAARLLGLMRPESVEESVARRRRLTW